MRVVIFGPPGTGKTHTSMGIISDMLHRGAAQEDIAFMSFSRAAVEEARSRIEVATGVPSAEFRWFKTLHSTWTRVQGVQKDELFDARAATEFGRINRYQLTLSAIHEPAKAGDAESDVEHDNPITRETNTMHDRFRQLYDWSRLSMLPMESVIPALPRGASFWQFTDFVGKFESYKAGAGKLDFTDIIIGAYRARLIHPCPYLIVDEAQDLAPLQIATLEPSIDAAAEVYVAGDDDQAIYAFQGASPHWLMSLTKDDAWKVRVLPKSYRCPEPVRRAAAIIAGRIRHRVPKEYAPRDGVGRYAVRVGWPDAVAAAVSAESAFFLARTGMFAGAIASALFAADVPYRLERGSDCPDPFRNGGLASAVSTLAAFGRKEPVGPTELAKALDLVPHDTKKARENGDVVYGWLDHGVKSAVKRYQKPLITPEDWPELHLERVAAQCERDLWAALAPKCEKPEELRWLRRQWAANGESWPEITVTIGTWHWSKGQQADVVVVDPSLSRACARSLASREVDESDTEHRCAYVALTRAKREALVLRTHRNAYGSYPFPEPT